MYEQFFGLADKPFSLTPNTRFVYSSTQFAEVEAQLLYGIGNHEGLMLVTGNPGTGKTTLCRALVEKLHAGKSPAALIFSPFVSGVEMLTGLLTEFGVNVPDDRSHNDLLDRLTQFVLAKHALGKSCVAIFDEAQHLGAGGPRADSRAHQHPRPIRRNSSRSSSLVSRIFLIPSRRLAWRHSRTACIDPRCSLGELDEPETTRYVHHRFGYRRSRWRGVTLEIRAL